MLGSAGIQRIHDTTLRVLDEVGIVIKHDKALDVLAQAGARVDRQCQRVRLSPSLIENALKQAPREFILRGLTPDKDIRLSADGPTHTRPASGPNFILDGTSRRRRKVTRADVERWVYLADILPNIDVVSGIHPQDVPQATCDVYVLAVLLQCSSKPIMMSGYAGQEVRWWAELLKAVPNQAGPRVMVLSSVNTPLVFSHVQCDLALECAKHGIPINVSSAGLVGAATPITLAGSLVQMNAEILAAITLIETAYPETPVVYSAYPAIFDVQHAMASYGGAEYGLLIGACIEIGRHYGLPTASLGMGTDAMVCDQQSGIERVLAGYLSFMMGTSIAGGAGALGQHGLASLEQMVIDDDIFGALRRQKEGIRVTADTLAFDVIARVGPENHYLDDEHTLAHMRSEYCRLSLPNRLDYLAWEHKGAKDINEKATARVSRLLSDPHRSPKLEPVVVKEMETIVSAASRELEVT
ncbi:MAG: trimethylamine methyltransferase family protein [Chloroflexi bacterium]|nr:trimethylamine methyltransferase family protein [Chloroflexota bacterium]